MSNYADGVKAVYFDMGGVLMAVDDGYSRENALEHAFSSPAVREYMGDDFQLESYQEFMGNWIERTRLEKPGIQEDAWMVDKDMLEAFTGRPVPFKVLKRKFWDQINYMTSTFSPVPGVIETLEEVRRKGYIVGLISNVFHPSIIFKELFFEWGIIDYFKPLLFSSDYRYKKPHVEIFNYALSWYPELKPNEVIFIGDTWDIDVVGAQGAGMRPIWVNSEHDERIRDGVLVIESVNEIANLLPELG